MEQASANRARRFAAAAVILRGCYIERHGYARVRALRWRGQEVLAMRELDHEEEPSGVARVGWVFFLLLVVVAMGLIVWASIEAALAPPMPPFAPGEIQLTASQKWIVAGLLAAMRTLLLVGLVGPPPRFL